MLTIRPATLTDMNDIDRLCTILSFLTKVSQVSPDQAREIFTQMDNQNTTLFLALWDKEIVGMASILLEYKLIRGGSLVAHIEDVVVHGDHHGKGIGKKLLETMIRHAQTAGAYKIILDCDEKMIDRYRTAGFVEKGVCMRYDISPV